MKRNFINLVQVTPGATEGLNNGLASGNRPDDRRLKIVCFRECIKLLT